MEYRHKGLKRLYEQDSRKGLPADSVDKLRKMLAFLCRTWRMPTSCGPRQPGRLTS